MGNLIAALSTYFLASRGDLSHITLLAVFFGTAFIVASGCVFNNVIDMDIDHKMARTRNRPLVQNVISRRAALIFATILLALGVVALCVLESYWALAFGLLGFTVYVGAYSLWGKRETVHGTLIGSISGACPPAMGYVAVMGYPDAVLLCIFLLYCIWQMPHSYAIAIFRHDDYQASNIPVLPVVKGFNEARVQMIVYIALFLVVGTSLYWLKAVSLMYLVGFLAVSVYWLMLAIKQPVNDEQVVWGRRLFGVSILVIMLFSMLISIEGFLNLSAR